MTYNESRRTILKTAATGAGFAFLGSLPPVSAEELKPDPNVVQLRPEIEPLVRFLEDTPRDRIIEEVAARIRNGLGYREVLAALLLAGVRNVQPRPAVGFKFHAVLVVHSAHLAAASGPDSDRWLPILWAIDDFKRSQARDTQEGNWTMAPIADHLIPPPNKARTAFIDAMDKWDEEAADAAVTGLARSASANQIFDLFVPYAARDLRSIGHKAIYLANAWRTLQVMGWEHAEPVLRSLAYALLNRRGDPNPAENDLEQDRPWKRNGPIAASLDLEQWNAGKIDHGAAGELLSALRNHSPDEASDHVARLLKDNVAPQSVIDAFLAGSSELMLRQPAIPALHAVTTTNAMHYLYQTCSDDETRRRLLLQNAAFLPLFREFMQSRGKVAEVKIDQLEAAEPIPSAGGALEGRGLTSARNVLGYATSPARAREVIDQVRRQIFLKGTDAHHYKFSSAVLEDYYHVSPEWRGQLLSCSTQYIPSGKNNPLVGQIREALG